jgi:tripartite-type tricarboxylate transporter receptor subunit TctC
MANLEQISGPLFLEKLPYNLIRDFLPISLIASTPYVLVINPSVAATSVKELISLAKAKPGVLQYGSSGVGGALHLAAEMFNVMSDTKLVHVPYKSVVYALIDVMGGQVQLAFSVMPAALPHIKQGKLRALGVSSLKRTPLAPDLETIAATVPGYEMVGWYGLMAPVKTPDAVITKVNAEVINALKPVEIREKMQALGTEPIGTTPQEFASFLRAQNEKIRKTIEASGMRAD